MAVASIKTKVLSGLKWNTLSVLATRGTDFGVKLLLARLLLPEAFGLVGMAMIITSFLEVVSDMGLFNALVQRKEDEQTQLRYSSAFWFLFSLASAFVLAFFLFVSPAGAAFYNEPQLVPVLNALSLYLFFNILTIVPRVILTKELNFKALVQTTYTGTVVSSIVAVAMALTGFGVWSLVAKSIVGAGILFLSFWIRVKWRPDFRFSARTLKELSGYSTFSQLSGILYFFRNNVDYLLIGKLAGATALGAYTLAFTLSEVLRAQLYSILNKVLFPVYSTMQDDLPQIRKYYLTVMRFTAIITFPIAVFFLGLADEFINTFFGHSWAAAAAPLRILSVATMIVVISGTPAEVLKGIGKPAVSFYISLLNTGLVAVPLIYLGQKYFGLTGVAYAVCLHYTTSRLLFHHYMKKYIHITDQDILRELRKPVVASAVMLALIYLTTLLGLPELHTLLLAGTAGSAAYASFFLKDFKQATTLLKRR
ncbi:lipopolysaccharide biosynthesis protein [Pontibacter mangrovi]|uniref:Lipopolysaccharide biosynthesis protein n=1 Tax=Pontibacter mangrovi TaxID=2589816 RepID=A0A501VZQ3_9BACT|nr:lipopolysaccharide biosynthesis protein [Pontibacter mangrovi]TPE42518.1 lipopolysaccharide biosynthesis protein [Pontibacter mangrovi]